MDGKILKVVICSGTACYVMGGSDLLLLEEHIPEKYKSRVIIEGTSCLGLCKDRKYGKAPYVQVGDSVIDSASVRRILEKIAEILG